MAGLHITHATTSKKYAEISRLRDVWDCSAPYFSALLHVFQLHTFCSRKKDEVIRAPKEMLHNL
jgi:hypothetical protein